MSSEQICYTIINNPTETETPNEQQLKHDIGMSRTRGVQIAAITNNRTYSGSLRVYTLIQYR